MNQHVRRRWESEGLTDSGPGGFRRTGTPAAGWPTGRLRTWWSSVRACRSDHPLLAGLPAAVPVIGELELGARFCRATMAAITGTNGKTTTTELVAHLGRTAGRRAEALGNVGRPLCLVAEELEPGGSGGAGGFQFPAGNGAGFRPRVGAVLNLAPDHLDRYPDLAAYFAAKKILADIVPADGTFVTWTGCPEARGLADRGAEGPLRRQGRRGARSFSGKAASGSDCRTGQPIAGTSAELALQSPPNLLNALAAAAIGLALDLDPEAVAAGLRDFPGLPHRHELVARRGGVAFINDTKATNVHAVCAGLTGFPDPVVLIAGGSGKGEDYSPLREVMDQVRHVVLIGEEGPAIGRALAGAVPTTGPASMEEAVAVAADLAEPDAVVLLSPACASFDMFANYGKRGEAFTAAARAGRGQPSLEIVTGPRRVEDEQKTERIHRQSGALRPSAAGCGGRAAVHRDLRGLRSRQLQPGGGDRASGTALHHRQAPVHDRGRARADDRLDEYRLPLVPAPLVQLGRAGGHLRLVLVTLLVSCRSGRDRSSTAG